jgi:hypothetical protein
MINYDLARERNLSEETVEAIEKLQAYRTQLGESYLAGKIGALMYREAWTDNEYELQALWGFPLDSNYHMFWDMAGCTCPRMDNRDSWGYDLHYYNGSCPIHGRFR